MQETWRWFGPDDPVTLRNVVQAGATGVVTSLHHVPTGEIWPAQDVMSRKEQIDSHGMNWAVVESLSVHNDIKTRSGDYRRLIDNYKQSLRHIGESGIEVVCYNFMPVVDWTRTSLNYTLPNGAQALRFEMTDFAAYDVYMLQRDGAASDYDPALLERARERFEALSGAERKLLEENIIAGLPGGEGSYDRAGIKAAIAQFIELGTEGLRGNLYAFLEEVVPVAEEVGVRLCIHPDDPPFTLFGLPRVVSTASDARGILAGVPSPSNGLTLCAGSFGARADNDLVGMVKEFGPAIHFVHLRNVRREPDGSFFESDHLDGDNDMVGLIGALLEEEHRRKEEGRPDRIPMRPDHGHLMGDDLDGGEVNPGYSFGGRMKGLAELRGVICALEAVRK